MDKLELSDVSGKKYFIGKNLAGLDNSYTIYDESEKEFCSLVDVFTIKAEAAAAAAAYKKMK